MKKDFKKELNPVGVDNLLAFMASIKAAFDTESAYSKHSIYKKLK